jgi:uncharacterized membrane protein YdjX (TVP38/TMEM64 family)
MPTKIIARHPRKIAALGVFVVLVVGVVFYLYATGVKYAEVRETLTNFVTWCANTNPIFYVLALAVLPYLGVPSSLIYLVAGSIYSNPAKSVGWSALGLALNLTLGYVIGTRWLRGPVTRWLDQRGWLREVPPGEFGRLVVLTRIIPGPPLVAQNFFLALAGVPFGLYFILSLPLALLYAAGFLLTSGALFKGNGKLVILGVSLMVALALLSHIVKTMQKAKQKKSSTPTAE